MTSQKTKIIGIFWLETDDSKDDDDDDDKKPSTSDGNDKGIGLCFWTVMNVFCETDHWKSGIKSLDSLENCNLNFLW